MFKRYYRGVTGLILRFRENNGVKTFSSLALLNKRDNIFAKLLLGLGFISRLGAGRNSTFPVKNYSISIEC